MDTTHIKKQTIIKDFENACYRGHLDIAEKLLVKNQNISISQDLFNRICCSGNVYTAKLLLSITPTLIISDLLFVNICKNRQFDIAKWALSINPHINITAYNNNAFRWVCHLGYIEMAYWLQSLKPYLYIVKGFKTCEIEMSLRGKIDFYINTKKEEKMENIIYGLWLQNDKCENTNNIINMLPVDISKNILSYV